MDFSVIGNKIKELRRIQRITQKELAEDICTQAQISKLENGEVIPCASTLFLISQKLGIDVNYFFNIGLTPRLDYVEEVARQLKIARRNFKYREMEEIVEMEERNPLFYQNQKYLQLLIWHKGICLYHVHSDFERSLQTLDEALELTNEKFRTEQELEILLSKGIVFFENNLLDEAIQVYESVYTEMKNLPQLRDYILKTKLLYNMARAFTRKGLYEKSTETCIEGIDWGIEKDNLFLLGELHYHIGYNFELAEDYHSAQDYMKKALLIFDLQKDHKYSDYINGKLMKWKEDNLIENT
ncbi:helix-turn-helix domain-containing protein [Cytobacillus firmus]|uniref:helix-turn-helix domain-containing protein n=1 Tax=Cytobacillus firmus TaxID=1399 RepID=UPI0018CDB981|nr:helix-turn-helix domain-containing protein [Cytobacillus firmus]MBG9547970.1 XRE family transcriptional regulator [Cytobacillus firmus]MBG9601435.1 XRE family transcriptional regulator [Cytobacillus firmus]